MKRTLAKLFVAAVAGLGLFSLASTASAADRFHVGVGVSNRGHEHVDRRWVPPVYEDRAAQVWVEPVYRTEYRPHWVKPEYRTVCERVWVEPVYEYREVAHRDRHGHRHVHRERVCVRQGGWQNVERQILVTPGHEHNQAVQVLVCAGHYETRTQRVCVREGYWETAGHNHNHRHDRERVSFDINFGGIFK